MVHKGLDTTGAARALLHYVSEQELLNKNWDNLGTRNDLRSVIQNITNIEDLNNYINASIAQKFSWASMRKTTREEDRAYSLLGLVGINMPLLYGEGNRAFERLQKELLAQTDDDSIFAWNCHQDNTNPASEQAEGVPPGDTSHVTSMLARSLDQFSGSTKCFGLGLLWEEANGGEGSIITVLLNCSIYGMDALCVELTTYDYFDWSKALHGISWTRTTTPIHSIEKSPHMLLQPKFFKLLIRCTKGKQVNDTRSNSSLIKFSTNRIGRTLSLDPKYCVWTTNQDNRPLRHLAAWNYGANGVQRIYEVEIDPDSHLYCDPYSYDAVEDSSAIHQRINRHWGAIMLPRLVSEASGIRQPADCLGPKVWEHYFGTDKPFLSQREETMLLYVGCDISGVGHFVLIIGGQESFVDLIAPASDFRFSPDFFAGPLPQVSWDQVKRVLNDYEACKNSIKEADMRSSANLELAHGQWLSATMELKNDAKVGRYHDITFALSTRNLPGSE